MNGHFISWPFHGKMIKIKTVILGCLILRIGPNDVLFNQFAFLKDCMQKVYSLLGCHLDSSLKVYKLESISL